MRDQRKMGRPVSRVKCTPSTNTPWHIRLRIVFGLCGIRSRVIKLANFIRKNSVG